jgi:hypothetical protein
MNSLAELREGLGISWDAVRANKMRSTLATLGIVIGIVTVTLMGAAINGLNQSFINSISSLGADVFHVARLTGCSTFLMTNGSRCSGAARRSGSGTPRRWPSN